MEFNEVEYRTARSMAETHFKNNKGYIDKDEILAAIFEWMVKHYEGVVELRDIDGGSKLLRQELYRAGQRFTYEERLRKTGAAHGDLHYYTNGQVEELLPSCWDYDDWYLTAENPAYVSTASGGDPAEGNNRAAMLVDVKTALWSLKPEDVAVLHMKYREGLSNQAIAHELGDVTEEAARQRVQRTVSKVVRALGGEPPWWSGPGSRKVRTNASAQSELREA